MAENDGSDFTVEESIRHRRETGTTPRGEDVDFLLSLVDELRAGKSETDFIEGWNSALDAVDLIMSTWYKRAWLIALRAPDSDEFKKALARRDDPLDERRGSGY